MTPRRVLFRCSRHRLRSPTAAVFVAGPGPQVDSAGLAGDAPTPLDPRQRDWADLGVVMEARHARRLRQRFGSCLGGRRVASIDIPERDAFMQPERVALLERRVGPLLRRGAAQRAAAASATASAFARMAAARASSSRTTIMRCASSLPASRDSV